MAVATRTLKDTVVGSGAYGGKVTVLITFDDSTASNTNVLDASGLNGHANGALLDITRLWWGINNGKDDDDKNWAFLEFVGASSDTLAINLAGTGQIYCGQTADRKKLTIIMAWLLIWMVVVL